MTVGTVGPAGPRRVEPVVGEYVRLSKNYKRRILITYRNHRLGNASGLLGNGGDVLKSRCRVVEARGIVGIVAHRRRGGRVVELRGGQGQGRHQGDGKDVGDLVGGVKY